MIVHVHFFISCGFCSSLHLSVSVFASHLQIWHEVDCIRPTCCCSVACRTCITPSLYTQQNPLSLSSKSRSWRAPVCLSVRKAAALSINVSSYDFVFLSVCLTCRQLSQRSRVAVSQVLVSVLLSIHLLVTVSQIRRVNLPPALPFSSGRVYKKVNKQLRIRSTLKSKSVVTLWNVLSHCMDPPLLC